MKKKIAIGAVIIGGIIILALIINAKMNGTQRNNGNVTNSKTDDWWITDLDIKPDPNWVLDLEIPDNYIPVPGKTETYMVIDENGNITSYRKRTKNENDEWIWSDITDNIPSEYEPVVGKTDIYRKKNEDGSYSYYKYVRNTDGSFAFADVDENGNEQNVPTGSTIPNNYKAVDGNEKSTIYAVYNDNNVITGYMERYIDEDGQYKWRKAEKPAEKPTEKETEKPTEQSTEVKPVEKPTEKPTQSPQPVETPTKPQESTRTETKTSTTSEVKGNYLITYTTTVTYVYDANNNLISTKTDGPTETARELISDKDVQTPNKSLIAGTLDAEYKRVSSQVSYETDIAKQVLDLLNNDRTSAGLPKLVLNDNVTKMANIKAADMALYNHSDYKSPMYGDISELVSRYSLDFNFVSESLWKTTDKTANEIHMRFQANSNTRANRMSDAFKYVGISVVKRNGYVYIYECYA